MVNLLAGFALVWGSVTAATALAVMAWRQRPQPGANAFATLAAGCAWWIATSSLGLFTVAPARRLLLDELKWLGIVTIPFAWICFALSYTSRDEYLTRRTVGLLGVVPAITVGLALTTQHHGLLYTGRTVSVYGAISLIDHAYGPWAWLFLLYAYSLLGIGTLLILQLAVETSTRYRVQALAILLSVLAPWSGNVCYLAGWVPLSNFDPTPFLFTISGVVGIAGLTQFNLLSTQPVSNRLARETAIESMDDGVIVVDADDRIVDVNQRAAAILDSSSAALLDSHATDAVPAYERLQSADEQACETVELDRHDGTVYYEVTRTDLHDHRESGSVVVFHDVTDRQNRVQQLDVLNRVLRHNLRNEMNVIHGFAEQLDDGEKAARIQAKARQMVSLGDKAREIDQILNGDSDSPVAVGNLVEIELERARERYPDIRFERSLPDRERRVPGETGPVLQNIIENAAEHNDSDRPRVSVDVTLTDDTTVIEVRDNGPGLPEEERAVMRTAEETPLQHSSGLGLWLVNWGAETMGGSVSVSADDGTVVRLEVPVIQTPAE